MLELSEDEFLQLLAQAMASQVADAIVAQLPVEVQAQMWFNVAQASAFTGLGEVAIRAAVKNKRLRSYTRGERSVSLHRSDLDSYMKGESR